MKNKLLTAILGSPLIIILFLTSILSISSFIYFYSHGHLNLGYGDSVSRLNIARKIIDNITPGLSQIGSVWLPLPFILMLPFIGNAMLWHTGIAGYIISGISYVLTIYYFYKLGITAFKSTSIGVLMAVLGMTSVNLIYMQSTAMSEPIFIATVVGSTYFLYVWAKTNRIEQLIISAFFISLGTLIRYEGYFIFLFACTLICAITYIKQKKISAIEGKLFLFTPLAGSGILTWILYNWAIFGDPLYWKSIYLGQKSLISTDAPVKKLSTINKASGVHLDKLFHAIWTLWSSAAQMNGIILTIAATACLFLFIAFLVYRFKFLRNPEDLVLLLPLGVFAFIAISIYGGLPLTLPSLTLSHLLSKQTNLIGEYNIRYGLIMFPSIVIFLGWIASKGKYLFGCVIWLLVVQLLTTFWTPFYTIYQIPVNFLGPESSMQQQNIPPVTWLKKHYTGGEIMISALDHNPDMFFLGYNYNTYIHEGTGSYWLDSRKNPQKYATWIYMYKPSKNTDDPVTKYLMNNSNLKRYFNLVYQDDKFQIYKIKTKPDIQNKI